MKKRNIKLRLILGEQTIIDLLRGKKLIVSNSREKDITLQIIPTQDRGLVYQFGDDE